MANLNTQFPSAAFTNKVKIAPGTQAMRMSTGLEIDVILPIVQAPFRVYYAYNPSVVREYLQPPIVLDPSTFPNAATLNNAIASYGTAYPLFREARNVPVHHRQDILRKPGGFRASAELGLIKLEFCEGV